MTFIFIILLFINRLDPDIREAVYYLFENQTNSDFVNLKLNPIELEDKLHAEHRV